MLVEETHLRPITGQVTDQPTRDEASVGTAAKKRHLRSSEATDSRPVVYVELLDSLEDDVELCSLAQEVVPDDNVGIVAGDYSCKQSQEAAHCWKSRANSPTSCVRSAFSSRRGSKVEPLPLGRSARAAASKPFGKGPWRGRTRVVTEEGCFSIGRGSSRFASEQQSQRRISKKHARTR